MHWLDSTWASSALTNIRSGLAAEWSVVSHWTGLPVPLGKATTKPSFCPRAPNWVVVEWMTAPSASPWKSRTSGRGTAAPAAVGTVFLGAGVVVIGVVAAGVVSRYHREAPPTLTFSC